MSQFKIKKSFTQKHPPPSNGGFVLSEEGASSKTPPFVVPDDLKQDIATVVRGTRIERLLDQGGGPCFDRCAIGYALLLILGWKPQPVLGGLHYRCGPDPRRDTISFCGPEGVGVIWNGLFWAHIWLEFQDHFLDFSAGDWRGLNWDQPSPDGTPSFGEPHWDAPPPEFLWIPKQDAIRPRGQSSPDLGKVWYTGFDHSTFSPDRIKLFWTSMLETVATPGMKLYLQRSEKRMNLRERAHAAQRGEYLPRPKGADVPDSMTIIGL